MKFKLTTVLSAAEWDCYDLWQGSLWGDAQLLKIESDDKSVPN